jgi:lysozyme
MLRLITVLLPILALLGGCSSTTYDLMDTKSIKKISHPSRFGDTDPHDFGHNYPDRLKVHGIDVSKWQGDIDWRKVKASGVSFVFIKATEGKDVIDPRFDEYWREARVAGLAYAPYHFYYFCSTPDEQADWFIRNVPAAAVALPPVLDAEWNPSSKTCKRRPDPDTVRSELKRFMDRLEAYYGKRPIIYTSVDFHRDNLVGAFQDHHFWLRSVAGHPGEVYPERRWAFWQYTSTGVVPGIDGPIDINAFAGTPDNWRNWVASIQ